VAESKVDVAVMVGGFLAARARLDEAIRQSQPSDEVFWPLFEALNWIVSLDEASDLSTMPDLTREATGVLVGLRWARNLTHHQWGMALVLKDVLMQLTVIQPGRPGIRGPSLVKQWHWCPARSLPRPTARLRQRKDEAKRYRRGSWHYTHRLANSPATSSLDVVVPYVQRLVA
jgi:hypothetical protein